MAELIDKVAVKELPVYEFGVSLLSAEKYVKLSDLEKLPTTTEAEIIMDFLQFVSDNASDYFFNSGWAMSDLIDLEFKYLEQLKERE